MGRRFIFMTAKTRTVSGRTAYNTEYGNRWHNRRLTAARTIGPASGKARIASVHCRTSAMKAAPKPARRRL